MDRRNGCLLLIHGSCLLIATPGINHIWKLIAPAGRILLFIFTLMMIRSQEPASVLSGEEIHPVTEASRLRDAGEVEAAISLLQEYLETNPGHPDATLLYAETLYWLDDHAEARAVFEDGIRRNPHDKLLKLVYARMLVETSQMKRAGSLLFQIEDDPYFGAEVEALLGTINYWEGNLSGAKSRFQTALRQNPDLEDTRRKLNEIIWLTVPWIHVTTRFQDDNQPLRQWGEEIEAGFYLTPLIPITAGGSIRRFRVEEGSLITTTSLQGGIKSGWPAVGANIGAMAGIFKNASSSNSEWTASIELDRRLFNRQHFNIRIERSPYLNTTSSLSESLIAESIVAGWRRESVTGWIAEASYKNQRYPDDNTTYSISGWALIPVWRSTFLTTHAGYAFRLEDSRENRFQYDVDSESDLNGIAASEIPGFYSPYYTPARLQVHDIIGDMEIRLTKSSRFQANAAYGFFGREDAPFFFSDAASEEEEANIQRWFYKRRFHPWSIRGSLTVDINSSFALRLAAEHSETAYYDNTEVTLNFVYRPKPVLSGSNGSRGR